MPAMKTDTRTYFPDPGPTQPSDALATTHVPHTFPTHLLSDADLIAAVTRLAGGVREASVQLVSHLAELDARRLYLGAGFSSLFAYGPTCSTGREFNRSGAS